MTHSESERQGLYILRSIVDRLRANGPFYEGAPDERTVIVHAKRNCYDNKMLPESQWLPVADELLLKIRELGYTTFVKLPVPCAVESVGQYFDPENHVDLRIVRLYDPRDGCMCETFSIGMNP